LVNKRYILSQINCKVKDALVVALPKLAEFL